MYDGPLHLCPLVLPDLPLLSELTEEQGKPTEVCQCKQLSYAPSAPSRQILLKVLTMIQTYQKTLAPFGTGPRPVCAGHSERKPVRTWEGSKSGSATTSNSDGSQKGRNSGHHWIWVLRSRCGCTYLEHREGDEQQPEGGMEVILEWTAADSRGPGARLVVVDGRSQGELRKVQHKDGDAPPLVDIVRTARLRKLNSVYAKSNTRDDNGTRCRHTESQCTGREGEDGSIVCPRDGYV